jgi:YggT family protein
MPIVIVLVHWGIELLILMVVVSSILSWFRPDPRNPVVKTLNAIVEPMLHPIRAILPAAGGMDFSPMVTILILWFLQRLLAGGIPR